MRCLHCAASQCAGLPACLRVQGDIAGQVDVGYENTNSQAVSSVSNVSEAAVQCSAPCTSPAVTSELACLAGLGPAVRYCAVRCSAGAALAEQHSTA
jgi:hypothetical protein